MEFFAYDHIKELVVYSAFGWMAGMSIWAYGWLIVTGVKALIQKLKKRFGRKNTEEETVNE
ncbi:MAG: hypothetical protein IJV41_01675 [Oscillospiraceae bacterium]|nr:hypothetical protein [Oscillospiraceae bacterium]